MNLSFDGLNNILTQWETNFSDKDLRWLAYMLATVHHETAQTFRPIEEYGKGKTKKYGIPDPETGKTYYGRGFVQLTWKDNYKKMAELCNADLVNDPALALNPEIASKILFHGMIHGSFTGKKLSDYFNAESDDYIHARKIINGLDKAALIAGYAREYYTALNSVV